MVATAATIAAASAAVADDDIDVAALRTVERYVAAQLRHDIEAIVGVMHPQWVDARGGRHALVAEKRQQLVRDAVYMLDPEWIALAKPRLVRARRVVYALVPASAMTPDFPESIEERFYFVALSEDQGKSWNVLEMSCDGTRWAMERFRSFPREALRRPPGRFEPVLKLQPPTSAD